MLPGTPPASAADADAAANPPTLQELPQVLIIGNTPLQGFGVPLNEVPSNVQTATGVDLQREQSLDTADYLNNNFSGINVSESAGNPFQIDVYYHGFTASPLLGTPEGLSVYVDGVRVNESFGDTVNWDLIPDSAINAVSLISGSNPVFGLNTLGGAISIQTKNGRDDPGTEIEAYDGSFGRHSFEAQTGGTLGAFDYFVSGNYFDETGWRDFGSSRVWQGFGKAGWQTQTTDLHLSYTYADDFLWGDGATPLSMLSYLREQTYTPDYTQNLMHFVNLTGTQILGDHLLLSGNAFYRYVSTGVLNGNVNDFYLEDNYAGPPTDCTDSGANPATLAYCAPGQDSTSTLTQRSKGFGLQLTDSSAVLGWKNQGVVGVDYDDSADDFNELTEYGGIAPDHQLVYEPSPYNDFPLVTVGGGNKILGTYFTDTLSPSELLHVTVAARYNRNRETIDGISVDADPGDYGNGFLDATPVTGDHTFTRLNPSVGFTLTPTSYTTYYANYNEASRAPTVIELGCADAAVPCGLPDDFAADPDLKQVVARTFEIGLRGNLADQSFNWSADVFHTVNSNDIQFVATSINAGFFDNVGNTRREGLDVAFGGREAGFTWKLAYSYVQATFQSSFVVNCAIEQYGRCLRQYRSAAGGSHAAGAAAQWAAGPRLRVQQASRCRREPDRRLRLLSAREREQRQRRRDHRCCDRQLRLPGWHGLDSGLRAAQLQWHLPIRRQPGNLCAHDQRAEQELLHRRLPDAERIHSERHFHRQPRQLEQREQRGPECATRDLGWRARDILRPRVSFRARRPSPAARLASAPGTAASTAPPPAERRSRRRARQAPRRRARRAGPIRKRRARSRCRRTAC